MKAKCRKCGDTVEVTRPREFKSCKCGAINLDYGDGYYYRVGGNPEDFDGEIEGVPELNDDLVYRPKAIKADNSMERAMDIIGEENIGGESRSMKKATEIDMSATNTRLVDTNLNNIATYLEELSDALEETSDLVSKISRLLMERSDKSEEFKNMMKGE